MTCFSFGAKFLYYLPTVGSHFGGIFHLDYLAALEKELEKPCLCVALKTFLCLFCLRVGGEGEGGGGGGRKLPQKGNTGL